MNFGYPSPHTYTIPNSAQLPPYTTQQTSPPESMSPTPSDVSPTSPRIHQYLQYRQPNQYKQIKEPRTPLYVPAVLRPTERYPKASPLTPPKSLHGSLDSLEGHHQGDMVDDPQQLDPVMENDYFPEEQLGEVTGPPTKEHWKVRCHPFRHISNRSHPSPCMSSPDQNTFQSRPPTPQRLLA
jgi:hypothetical protein